MADVRERLQADLRDAIRTRDRARVSVLRTALAALANAESVDTRAVLAGVRDDLLVAANEIARLGRPADAENLRAQAAMVEGYLG